MVKISCKEMKLDEITVTSQPNIPSTPAVAITDKLQVMIGKMIQRI